MLNQPAACHKLLVEEEAYVINVAVKSKHECIWRIILIWKIYIRKVATAWYNKPRLQMANELKTTPVFNESGELVMKCHHYHYEIFNRFSPCIPSGEFSCFVKSFASGFESKWFLEDWVVATIVIIMDVLKRFEWYVKAMAVLINIHTTKHVIGAISYDIGPLRMTT